MTKISLTIKNNFAPVIFSLIMVSCSGASIEGHLINNCDDTLVLTSPSGTDTLLPNKILDLEFHRIEPSIGVTYTCCPCMLVGEELALKPVNPGRKLTKNIHSSAEWKTILPSKGLGTPHHHTKCYFTINKQDIIN